MPLQEFACSLSTPSTSRTATLNPESGQNQCITIWEPVQLRQEWTVCITFILLLLLLD